MAKQNTGRRRVTPLMRAQMRMDYARSGNFTAVASHWKVSPETARFHISKGSVYNSLQEWAQGQGYKDWNAYLDWLARQRGDQSHYHYLQRLKEERKKKRE